LPQEGVYHPSVSPFVTSISSRCFKVRELRFGTQTPHLNPTKLAEGIFEILLGAELRGPWG